MLGDRLLRNRLVSGRLLSGHWPHYLPFEWWTHLDGRITHSDDLFIKRSSLNGRRAPNLHQTVLHGKRFTRLPEDYTPDDVRQLRCPDPRTGGPPGNSKRVSKVETISRTMPWWMERGCQWSSHSVEWRDDQFEKFNQRERPTASTYLEWAERESRPARMRLQDEKPTPRWENEARKFPSKSSKFELNKRSGETTGTEGTKWTRKFERLRLKLSVFCTLSGKSSRSVSAPTPVAGTWSFEKWTDHLKLS